MHDREPLETFIPWLQELIRRTSEEDWGEEKIRIKTAAAVAYATLDWKFSEYWAHGFQAYALDYKAIP